MDVPAGPEAGLTPEMLGITVNVRELLAPPLTVTTTLPVSAPEGTEATMVLGLHEVGIADTPLKVTALAPCAGPKPPPLITTDCPTGPEVGLRLVMLGTTVKGTPLLNTELLPLEATTTTFPVVAVAGTGTTMFVALQLVGVPDAPLKVTELLPCEAPKLVPVIVTAVPNEPEVGFTLVIVGTAGVTLKGQLLLIRPLTVIDTLPADAPVGTGTTMLVALQLVGVAAIPLNVTVLVPCVAPKFVPVMVTEVPTGPDEGLRLLMNGLGEGTVKITVLLPTPWTATHNRSFPIAAPAGTGTVILVSLQLVGVPFTPANETMLVPCVAPKNVPVIVTEVPAGPEVGFREEMFGGFGAK